jgi:subtilisin family serine protease
MRLQPRQRWTLWLSVAALLLFMAPGVWGQTPRHLRTVTVGSPRLVTTATGQRYFRPNLAVADRVLVRLRPSLQTAGLPLTQRLVKAVDSEPLGHGLYALNLPEGSDVNAAVATLRSQWEVLSVEPDLIVYPARIPNDPLYSQQYHLPQIKAPQAWDVTTGATDIVIAIIDSGVQLTHPDLAAKIWVNPGEIAGNGRDDDNNGFVDDVHGWDFYDNNNNPNPVPNGIDENRDGTPDEQVSHGTLVAGLAAAASNNSIGVAGVSWGARIMALKVFPDDGGTAVSTVINAINYAAANGAHVINLSIGGGYSESFNAPIAAAYNAGCVIISAGGNSGSELTNSRTTWESPVCNDGSDVFTQNHVLGIGAVDRFDRRASYSNFDSSSANFIDLTAPGDSLYGPTAYFPLFPRFTQYYGTNTGTSFSAPLISGLAALVLSQNRGAGPGEIYRIIKSAADNIDALNPGFIGKLGAGRANCGRAVGVQAPPAPAQDLAAVDTPGDDGGSITVTWRKSPDDGGGSDKVTSYTVLRRRSGETEPTEIANLPRGTEQYVDSSVTDGVDYYYTVRVSDGTQTSVTEEIGPVRSRNDQPPPLVQGVVAADRENDQGGAIVVRWNAYTPPADFHRFIIYRSTFDFATTQGLTPLTTLTNASATSYTDTATTDGVDYYYAVAARDTAGNERRDLRAVGPVQSFPNGAITFAPGLHFLGPPAVPPSTDPADLFTDSPATLRYARWSPATSSYMYYAANQPLPEVLQLGLGHGFWVNFPQQTVVHASGQSAPAGDYDLDLTPGWHQLANPYFGAIDFGEVTITRNGATMDLLSADGAGIMAAFCWVFDNPTQQYVLAYPPLGQSRLISPWRGFWVLVYQNCRLTINRPLSPANRSLSTQSSPVVRSAAASVQPEWVVPLQISAGGRVSECQVGVAARALTIPSPPPAHSGPRLTLTAAGRSGAEAATAAVALAQKGANTLSWDLLLTGLQAGQPITVHWPDLSRLPADRQATVQDLATGETIYLRTTSGYSLTPSAGESQRLLRLALVPRVAGSALAVSGLVSQAARGNGAQVMFTLSQPAAATATVTNIAGRTVRVLEQEKMRPAGNNMILWDGRNQFGSAAPAGLYLLQVEARTPEGQSVRAMTSFRLQR